MDIYMNIVVPLLIIINGIVLLIIFITWGKDSIGLSFVNPLVIYYSVKVNWFGCILLTILVNGILPLVAIPYWIYKICTVGRR